jgi:hypothetical protein
MEFRKFKNNDAVPVSNLIKECFNTIDLGGHTEEGKRLQIEGNSPQNLIKRAQSTRYFIAIDTDSIMGICGYDKYKIQTLFVDVGYVKMGSGLGK